MNIWFKSVKEYYNMGLYTKENVAVFVKARFINENEYKQITGEDYAE